MAQSTVLMGEALFTVMAGRKDAIPSQVTALERLLVGLLSALDSLLFI